MDAASYFMAETPFPVLLYPSRLEWVIFENFSFNKTGRLSHFRLYIFFASKRNEAKQKPFRFLFASFCETKTIIFRFVSLQFFRFVSLHFFNFCYNYYLRENGGRREEWGWTTNF